MGVFNRMSNMLKAKVNSKLDDMENPIESLDLKIRNMEEDLSKAKMQSASAIGNHHSNERKLEEAKKEVADYESKIQLAMSKGNEDLARKAAAKKIEADKKVATLTDATAKSKVIADNIKAKLSSLENEIKKTKDYRDEAAARYSTAKASKQVNTIMADIETKSNQISLDNIERKIANEEAMASGLEDLASASESDLDSEFAKLEADSVNTDIEAELAKYRNPQQ